MARGGSEEWEGTVLDNPPLCFSFLRESMFIEPVGHDAAGAGVVWGGVEGVMEEEEGGIHCLTVSFQENKGETGEDTYLAAVLADQLPERLALGDGEEAILGVREDGVGELLVEGAWLEAAGVKGFYGLSFVGHGSLMSSMEAISEMRMRKTGEESSSLT